jgi:AraC-like DNA-binding protein
MVSGIISFLYENMHRNITLEEISVKYGLNPRYLNLIFKNITGYPIFQYLQQLKVEKAKRLLVTTSLKLIDIAAELNLGSSQYLNFIFKKVTGITPLEYRINSRVHNPNPLI